MVKHFISLGAGVQSSTMALMAAHGEITPMPDAAIFADTQAEPASVYKWLDWLEGQLPFPVVRVGRENVIENALKVRTSKTGSRYVPSRIPAFTRDGLQSGQLRRQCTAFWKIDPIHQYLKQFKLETVSVWMGISTDEAHRMKDSPKKWITNRFPLIEAEMSRQSCLDWMRDKGYPMPPRSSCVFCPYHSDAEWLRLKTEEPDEFARAVEFEDQLRTSFSQIDALASDVFLHSSRKPLDQVQFRHQDQRNLFGNECEGMCGV